MIQLADLLAATGGRVVGEARATEFTDFAYDSRTVQLGQLFVAVVTETGDGHDYIAAACRAGATGVLCQRPPEDLFTGVTYIQVENSQTALSDYARYILATRRIEVIGVTGSVGKTSAKETIAAVLAERYPVFKNHGNYNGRYGLPIALGRLEPCQRLAVLEMAADSLDEIRELAALTRPRVGVVTAVGHSHVEYLGSLDTIAREKGRLIEALPVEGVAALNADDPRVAAMAAHAQARIITYGRGEGAMLRAENVAVARDGTRLEARWQGEAIPLYIPLIGAHHAYTALAAAAVGLAYDLSWEEIAAGLSHVQPQPGRTRLLAGVNGLELLDDSYNASPESTLAALETLRALSARRRWAVLGHMAQLGEHAIEGHRRVGRACAQVADELVVKGDQAQLIAEEAARYGLAASRIHIAYTASEAAQIVRERAQPGDLLLIKGSAEARMEHITRELLAEPEHAAELLPRQGPGWAQVRLERPGRPTWVEIDLEAIAHNTRRMAEIVGPDVALLAVLKADGYGHGAIKIARTALHNGASWLGVACLSEAVTLRRAGLDAPILVLGYTPAWQAREAVLNDVTVTIFALPTAEALSQAALDLGRTARAQVKVDTGMGRLGLLPDEVLPFMRQARRLPGLEIGGLFTHMSDADADDLGYTRWQLAQFEGVLVALRAEGLLPPLIHAANSACALRLADSHYNMARIGIALYGLAPSPHAPLPADFRPALSFKCQIAQVKELPAGSYVSYGRAYRAERPTRIAVIPVGYADGFRRAPAHWGEVLVRGRRAPIVGRVCMDQTMLDVTDIPGVRQGDEVVLIGAQGDERITVDEVAARLGTINYEVVSEILARVPRVV